MSCPLCHEGHRRLGGDFPQMVCEECDQRAVNANGETPWTGYPPEKRAELDDPDIEPPDDGENPVFIDGQKCWRRYRFGGWVTYIDYYDCDTLREFYVRHGLMAPRDSSHHSPSTDDSPGAQPHRKRRSRPVDQHDRSGPNDGPVNGEARHSKQDREQLRDLVVQAAEIDCDALDTTTEIQRIAEAVEDERLGPLAARYLVMVATDAPDEALEALPTVSSVYGSVTPEVRQWLMYYFARLSQTQPEALLPVLDTLVEGMAENDTNIQSNALATLGRIISKYPQPGAGLVDELVELLGHDHAMIRANAVGLLGDIAPEYQRHVAVHISSIATCLTDADATVRRNASIALVECGEADPEAIREQSDQLEAALADDQREVRKNACVLIGNAQPAISPEPLRELAEDDPDAKVRELAEWALAQVTT